LARRLLILAAILALLFAAALAVDLPVLAFCRRGRVPGDLRKLFDFAEVFAHGIGVACIVLTVLVLDRARRRHLPRLLACAFGSGLIAIVSILMVARTRPRNTEFQRIWYTFVGWCPWLTSADAQQAFDSSFQSFPSAHTATGVGFAVGLSVLYPQGRWLFAFFAVLAAMQRVV